MSFRTDMSAWDVALSNQTNRLLQQILAADGEQTPHQVLVPVLQRLRQFIEETTNRREASPAVAAALLILHPILENFYPRDEDDANDEELLEIFCEPFCSSLVKQHSAQHTVFFKYTQQALA